MIRIDEIDLEMSVWEFLRLAGAGVGIMAGIITALWIAKAVLGLLI